MKSSVLAGAAVIVEARSVADRLHTHCRTNELRLLHSFRFDDCSRRSTRDLGKIVEVAIEIEIVGKEAEM